MAEGSIKVWVTWFRDRGCYVLQWLDPETGKRKSQSADTDLLDVARMKATVLEADLNRGFHKEVSRISWEKFRQRFEAEYFPNCRPSTITVFTTVFNHFERLCAPTSLRSITAQTISRFAAACRKLPGKLDKEGWSPWTVKVRLQFLRTALLWACAQKLILDCPAFPDIRVPKTKPRPVPAEPVERLLDKADPQLRVYLLCGWLAGMRRNEALALEWEETDKAPWLDLKRRRIWLPAGFVKSVEDQWIPLDPVLVEALASLPREGAKVFRFLRAATGLPVSPSGMSLLITKLAKAAGVKLSMKILRKGFGSRYAGKVPAQVLQKLMRHANISTTMDFYCSIDHAVEEAVWEQRNDSCNKPASKTEDGSEGVDASANPCQGLRRVDEAL